MISQPFDEVMECSTSKRRAYCTSTLLRKLMVSGKETSGESLWSRAIQRGTKRSTMPVRYFQWTKSKYLATFSCGHGVLKVKDNIAHIRSSLMWLVSGKEISAEALWISDYNEATLCSKSKWIACCTYKLLPLIVDGIRKLDIRCVMLEHSNPNVWELCIAWIFMNKIKVFQNL